MSWLLDTNVISESRQKTPNARVMEWMDSLSDESLFLSAVTVGELQRGIILLPDSAKRRRLMLWLREDVPQRFSGRILSLDEKVALVWGNLVAAQQMKGRVLPALDSLIAATASAHQLTLVTRNTTDVQGLGVNLYNPWTGQYS